MSPNFQSIDAMQFERERRGYPDKIFALAARNPVVAALVASWRRGGSTWEACLAEIVLQLASQNEKLLDAVTLATSRSVAVPPGEFTLPKIAGDNR